jgi:hypothetical protein
MKDLYVSSKRLKLLQGMDGLTIKAEHRASGMLDKHS